ncbi:hypothetical protein [Schaalia cardiffensis]
MESAAQRLRRAREALRAAEYGSGLARSPSLGEKRGAIHHVEGGRAVFIDALIHTLPAAGWAGFLGVADFGWEAAARAGLDLERVLTIPDPKGDPARIAALLIESFDVVCIGEELLNLREKRTLAAKARSYQCTILLEQAWTGISRPYELSPSQAVAS